MKKAFKILTLFVVFASMAALNSCGKDPSTGIIGKWECTYANIVYDDGEEYNATAYLFNGLTEFRTDGTVWFDDEYECNYSVTGKTLVMYEGTDDPENYTITKLTSSAMELEGRYEDEEDPDYNCTAYLKFVRR